MKGTRRIKLREVLLTAAGGQQILQAAVQVSKEKHMISWVGSTKSSI